MESFNRINLYVTAGGWMARFAGPHAAGIMQLFETDVLPTGFTARAEAVLVLSEIRRLNPDAIVTVEASA